MVKRTANRHGRALLLLALVLTLLLGALSSCFQAGDPLTEKERLAKRVSEIGIADCDMVADCFLKWQFPRGYDTKKLREVESTIHGGYYEAVNTAEMAKTAAECFLEHLYDTVDFEDRAAYTDALIQCMVFALGDNYAIYRTAEEYADYTGQMSGSYGGIGMTVRKDYEAGTITVIRLIENAPAQRAGVMIGDQICLIEGETVTAESLDSAFEKMQGEVGESVRFSVKRGQEILPFEITRENLDNMTVSYTLTEDKIAYISVSSFKRTTYKYFAEAVKKAEEAGAVGFIFDMRDNPGGYLDSVLNVLEYLVPVGTPLFSFGTKKEEPTVYSATNEHIIDEPCVVLCNWTTASAGELFTAALRDYNDMGILSVTVVGTDEATYGKGIMQSSFHLSDNSVITMTTAFYNPPCGVNYHGEGVVPDVLTTEEEAMGRAEAELQKLISNQNK